MLEYASKIYLIKQKRLNKERGGWVGDVDVSLHVCTLPFILCNVESTSNLTRFLYPSAFSVSVKNALTFGKQHNMR